MPDPVPDRRRRTVPRRGRPDQHAGADWPAGRQPQGGSDSGRRQGRADGGPRADDGSSLQKPPTTLTEKYLENGTLTNEEVVQALREGTMARRFVPVLCGAASKAIGVAAAARCRVNYLASAADLGTLHGEDPKIKEPIERDARTSTRRSPASCSRPSSIRSAGKLSIFRVLSGKVTADSTVLNVNKDSKERLGHIFKLAGKKQDPGAPRDSRRDRRGRQAEGHGERATRSPTRRRRSYPGFVLPPPAISFAVEPKSQGRRGEGGAGADTHDGGGPVARDAPRPADARADPLRRRSAAHRGGDRAPEAKVRRRRRAQSAEGALQGDHQGHAPRRRASSRSRRAAAASTATPG